MAHEQALPQWLAFGRAHTGWALSMQGRSEIGIPLLVEAIEGFRRMSHMYGEPHVLAMLAQAYRQAGRLSEALEVLDRGATISTETHHLTFIAELYRQRGSCLIAMGNEGGSRSGEMDLLTAIDIARRQGAGTFELRSATDLASLWAKQGRRNEALDLLAPVYAWFTEGFDTKDLIEAKALLEELR